MSWETGLLALAIVGVVSGLKMTGKVSGWVTIFFAVALGALAGWGNVEGLNIVTGILTGCAAVGTVSVADRIGLVK